LPGGRVAVAAHPAKDGNGAAETAVIVVSDGGIGIPEGEIEHVFDRMYRATTAKDRDIKGTGLGLSVTKALVEAHSGTITVVNRPEGGTRFTVAIPVQRPAQAVPPDRVRV
jgi:signal transduction histidine kinase